ncbi:hypothetical protein MGG_17103 [Pyricularia oryzae 70-15]|uniref:Fatty acid hydroxylase domain-containing protein n=3 Tax=Pyricularia oryzae TaxID=318829 RepID=G4N8W3_PYRO7|nr:uncharacterized protein MGG_17103 [Pyricularia oryzae 70-15]EHA50257.1 hypothetical protein MGG_17103 [Pyricularia oryzae 70-15]KAI7911823.1 hypothetical protein M0657_010745 [Pyricularia oryzae]KAI7928826.1 hypothetical protein M9X92_001620 [Pyricularia oryzae]
MLETMANVTGVASATDMPIQAVFAEVSQHFQQLTMMERLWATWYTWMQNDVLATGLLTFIIHEVVYFGRSIPWIIMDSMPIFQKYKIQQTKVPTIKEQLHCAGLVLLSHFTVELPEIWVFHPVAIYCGMAFDVPFPPAWKIALHIAVFFVLEDAWHYWTHRLMHYPPLYRSIHKLHHTYTAPFGLTAEYASPIEVLVLGLGTAGTPLLWVYLTGDLHLFTMQAWIVLRLLQAVDAHSGYEFPWSLHHILPFWAGAQHHDIHHEQFVGNYASSFRWWDYFMDTEAGAEANAKRRERKMAALKKTL